MEKRVSTGEEELPPPYSATPSESLTSFRPSDSTSFAADLYTHLIAVPDRIRQNRQLRNLQQVENDAWMADHINRKIIGCLERLGEQSFTSVVAALAIVPASAVPETATWGETDELKRRGEIGRVVRVELDQHEKEKGGDRKNPNMFKSTESVDQSWIQGGEFDDWGRFGTSSSADDTSFWFKDESMARRLASYIELPEALRITRTEPTSSVQQAVEQELPAQKKSRGWGWGSGRRKNNASTEVITSTPSAASIERGGPRGTVAGGDVAGSTGSGFYRPNSESAQMDVTAEQVAFRCSSEMGLLESLSGWAIIVKVKLS
ncbi:hypothetical protein PG993_007342 [Apiospora rasikravindrae]|uniref:Uncharacterized protein n=1 Tax=Apiospora rasikravindrae TaxID=990691 RepID=A0ABR1SYM1_9PEZI